MDSLIVRMGRMNKAVVSICINCYVRIAHDCSSYVLGSKLIRDFGFFHVMKLSSYLKERLWLYRLCGGAPDVFFN